MVDGFEIILPKNLEGQKNEVKKTPPKDRGKGGFERILKSSQSDKRSQRPQAKERPESPEEDRDIAPLGQEDEFKEQERDASIQELAAASSLVTALLLKDPDSEKKPSAPLDYLTAAEEPAGVEDARPIINLNSLSDASLKEIQEEVTVLPASEILAGIDDAEEDAPAADQNPLEVFDLPEIQEGLPEMEGLGGFLPQAPAGPEFQRPLGPEAPDGKTQDGSISAGPDAHRVLGLKAFFPKASKAQGTSENPKDSLAEPQKASDTENPEPKKASESKPESFTLPSSKIFSQFPGLEKGKNGHSGKVQGLNERLSSMMKDVMKDMSNLGPGVERNYGPLLSPSPGLPQPQVLAQRGPEGLSQGVMNVIRFLQSNGEIRAQIVVEPPSLGRIEVSVHAAPSGNLEASFHVENAGLRDMIKSQLPLLQDLLAQAGINVSEMNVDVRSGGGENRRPQGGKGPKNRRVADLDLAEELEQQVPVARLDLEQGLLLWIA